jgi:hypothetical protein
MAVGNPAPNPMALAVFDYSLLSIIHLSELVFCWSVIFTVVLAINDKNTLSVKHLPTISPFGIDGN